MSHTTKVLAEYAISSHRDMYTSKDTQMVLLSVMDWIGAAVAGKDETCVQKLIALDAQYLSKGHSTIFVHNMSTSPVEAALLNGTMSHVLDFDDIHDYFSLHLCSSIMPAAFATAELVHTTGPRFLDAIINGAQIVTALAAGVMPEHYNKGRWHATATLGIFGAAAAAGYLLKLDEDKMCNAFGIAANLCSGIQLNFGTMAKSLCVGMAAKNGLLAALLANNGFTGRDDIFDTDFLMHISTKADSAAIKDSIEKRLEGDFGINEIRFKYYPCGAPTHSGLINCKKIMEQHSFRLEDIKEIVLEPYPRAIRLAGNMNPQTGLEGKFSIGFTAAAQLVFGDVTIETFTDEHVRDCRVRALMEKMKLIPNDEFTRSRGGKATIYLKDGRSYSNSTYILGHDIDPFVITDEVVNKFKTICNLRLGEGRSQQLQEAILTLEKADSCDSLSLLLR